MYLLCIYTMHQKTLNYRSINYVVEYLKVLRDFLDENFMTDLKITGELTILADESTNSAKLTTSKKAADLHATIISVFQSRGIDLSKVIQFSGLDGTSNASQNSSFNVH